MSLKYLKNTNKGAYAMQTRLRDFKDIIDRNCRHNPEEQVTLKSFSRTEQRYFVRDCLHFIKENEYEPELQEKLSAWVADRKRRYGIPLNNNEVTLFEELLAGIYPNYNLSVRK
jgi:hypothetical protein